MKVLQKALPETFFAICSALALVMTFLVVGIPNFTLINWIALALASFGLVANSLIIILKVNDI